MPPPTTGKALPGATSSRQATSWPFRLVLIAAFAAIVGVAYAAGLHKELSLETLVRNRALIDEFITARYAMSLAIFVGIYTTAVALSIPAALFLTIAAGALFGPVVGPLVSITGATAGGTIVFLIAKTALGEQLFRRAGPLAGRLADGFQSNAFVYLLVLRLAPVFPFWLVNLAPALFGVPLRTFLAATAIGITPASFAFGFVGNGLDSIIAAQAATYKECLAAGRADCRVNFELGDVVTPELLAALGGLAVVALLPVLVKRLRARKSVKS
jgi:uncharacterized membrane protein YdjX (TVP38/TMEM64 family)